MMWLHPALLVKTLNLEREIVPAERSQERVLSDLILLAMETFRNHVSRILFEKLIITVGFLSIGNLFFFPKISLRAFVGNGK
jgi:hypothetical protein